MLIIKRFILWTLLFFLAITQLLLYLPDFSCSVSVGLPLCTPQFQVSIVTGTRPTQDFVTSVRQFLKLVSYLAIDMGWSKYLESAHIYNDENLVDTFNPNNGFSINYFGYCKSTDGRRVYCISNSDNGMDILGILVRDVGIQLGKLSPQYETNSRLLGDSLVLTYHLAVSSLRSILRSNRYKNNAFSKLLFEGDSNHIRNYSKGVGLAFILTMTNKGMFYIHLAEIVLSGIFVLSILLFGFVLIFGKHHRFVPKLLKICSTSMFTVATMSYMATITYLATLKLLEPADLMVEDSKNNNWELLDTSVGSGFIISCFRYIIQCLTLPLVFIAANRYSYKDASLCPTSKSDVLNKSTEYPWV
ncbi:Sma2p [Nakaseomyces bracarensis]|uniref:Sma2p n=1 Tax=Nakaseomyces bracarensis TaxID=273131 RepID=UPI0038712A66